MNLSEEQRAAIESMTEEGDIYSRLANSIAPGAWETEEGQEVKRVGVWGGASGGLFGHAASMLKPWPPLS